MRKFLSEFDGFVAFHACRPHAVTPYYCNGLTIADHDRLTAVAREIFLTDEFPEITAAEFDMIHQKDVCRSR
ncbi:MAG: hypothetical protein DME86_09670 [Verrucomicrobia bacterium]|nr:MAG: hypothetical protein DME86_09670 [Verrucomicrobiota bacterium]